MLVAHNYTHFKTLYRFEWDRMCTVSELNESGHLFEFGVVNLNDDISNMFDIKRQWK